MYVRKATRRRLYHISLVCLALILVAPKFEPSGVPQLAAVLVAVGLEVPHSS